MRLASSVALAVLMLTGCSSADPEQEDFAEPAVTESEPEESTPEPSPEASEPEPEPEPAADTDPVEVGLAYVEALNGDDVEAMEEMGEIAAADSPAAVYAGVQIAGAKAQRADGIAREPSTVRRDGDTIVSGVTFADFEVDSEGRLTSFTIDGDPAGTLLAAPQEPVDVGDGATVTLLGAYRSAEYGGVVVTLELQASESDTLNPYSYSAEYITPDGEQRSAETAFGPTDIREGVRGFNLIAIPESSIGGTFILEGDLGDDFDRMWEVEFDLTAME